MMKRRSAVDLRRPVASVLQQMWLAKDVKESAMLVCPVDADALVSRGRRRGKGKVRSRLQPLVAHLVSMS